MFFKNGILYLKENYFVAFKAKMYSEKSMVPLLSSSNTRKRESAKNSISSWSSFNRFFISNNEKIYN